MTIEFITKRIEGKEKEITKLEKKLERIKKAEASNWENNPYYYNENDLKWTTKDLESAKKSLEDYKEMFIAETEKSNSRNIQVIIDFLNDWKERVKQSYIESLPRYIEAKKEFYVIDHEYTDWFNYQRRHATAEEYKTINEEYRRKREAFYGGWKWFVPYIEKDQINIKKLEKELDREADSKYDFIIERTNAIVGQITDAQNLKIGAKGDLNGYIIGEKGKAKVQTIGAGGYNIQCYHFRTLINKMK